MVRERSYTYELTSSRSHWKLRLGQYRVSYRRCVACVDAECVARTCASTHGGRARPDEGQREEGRPKVVRRVEAKGMRETFSTVPTAQRPRRCLSLFCRLLSLARTFASGSPPGQEAHRRGAPCVSLSSRTHASSPTACAMSGVVGRALDRLRCWPEQNRKVDGGFQRRQLLHAFAFPSLIQCLSFFSSSSTSSSFCFLLLLHRFELAIWDAFLNQRLPLGALASSAIDERAIVPASLFLDLD